MQGVGPCSVLLRAYPWITANRAQEIILDARDQTVVIHMQGKILLTIISFCTTHTPPGCLSPCCRLG